MIIVVDTSALIHQPELLESCYASDDIIIPEVVISELDGLKSGTSSRAVSAREVFRIIESCETTQDEENGLRFIRPCGGYISITREILTTTDKESSKANDEKIISVAKDMTQHYDDVILLTQDRAMSILATIDGVVTQRHESTRKTYNGEIVVLDTYSGVIDDMYSQGYAYAPGHNLQVNTGVIVKEGSQSALGIVEDEFTIKHIRENFSPCGVNPVDASQKIAMDLLHGGHSGNVAEEFLGALSGRSGSGKTTLAIATGISAVQQGYYDRVIVFRPSEPVGKDIGFLPGGLDEKMEPWKQAIYDVTRTLGLSDVIGLGSGGKKCVPLEDILTIENINFVRGRTFTRSFVIVDEAQNLSMTELRTLASRCGMGSAFVCTFDPSQVDNAYLKEGRAEGVERFLTTVSGNPSAWHVRLTKPVRGGVSAIVE